MIEGVNWTPLKIIEDHRGSIRHGLRSDDAQYNGFGEAYFSSVRKGVVKGWKLHSQMISNLIVVEGEIRFVLFDDRIGSSTRGQLWDFVASLSNYGRLTVPPGVWMSFQGMGDNVNLLLNLSSILHDPTESQQRPLDSTEMPDVDWSLQ